MKRVAVTLALLAPFAAAQSGLVDPSDMPGPLKDVRFDQRVGAELPLDAAFVDEKGEPVKLADYYGERPVVLAFVYYECPMLCHLTLHGLTQSLDVVDLEIGSEIDVVLVSIDPGEGPAEAVRAKADRGPGWHFLTGQEAEIARLAGAVGFGYVYLPEDDEYAHSSGIVITTPEGRIAQYFFGVEYPPKDVRLALVEASSGRIGSMVDQLLLYCFRFDPDQGRYTAATLRILRLAAAATALAVFAYLWVTWRGERSRARRPVTVSGGAARR